MLTHIAVFIRLWVDCISSQLNWQVEVIDCNASTPPFTHIHYNFDQVKETIIVYKERAPPRHTCLHLDESGEVHARVGTWEWAELTPLEDQRRHLTKPLIPLHTHSVSFSGGVNDGLTRCCRQSRRFDSLTILSCLGSWAPLSLSLGHAACAAVLIPKPPSPFICLPQRTRKSLDGEHSIQLITISLRLEFDASDLIWPCYCIV